jgi:hypothetical protein
MGLEGREYHREEVPPHPIVSGLIIDVVSLDYLASVVFY